MRINISHLDGGFCMIKRYKKIYHLDHSLGKLTGIEVKADDEIFIDHLDGQTMANELKRSIISETVSCFYPINMDENNFTKILNKKLKRIGMNHQITFTD